MIERRGWRGPITNKHKNKNWEKKISRYKLDPTLNWHVAEIISLNEGAIGFNIIDKKKENIKGNLLKKNIKWSTPKNKSIQDIHKIGDIIFRNRPFIFLNYLLYFLFLSIILNQFSPSFKEIISATCQFNVGSNLY